MAKSGPVTASSFLTPDRESNILKRTSADWAGDGFVVLPNAGKMPVLRSFAGEDGDAFCERLGWLRVKTPSEFHCIAAQSFAAFGNHFLELRQFAGQRFIAAFLLQARTQKIEIVLAPQQFAQDLRVVSHLFQDRSVQWLQNSQLIPDILHPLAPGMKIFRVRILNRCSKCALAAP